MTGVSAFVIFSEDIRFEALGSNTIIGTINDNVEVPAAPFVLPKLGIYVRVNIPLDAEAHPIRVFMRGDRVDPHLIADYSVEDVLQNISDAVARDSLSAGVVFAMVANTFQINEFGRIYVDLEYGPQRMHLGSVNFKKAAIGEA